MQNILLIIYTSYAFLSFEYLSTYTSIYVLYSQCFKYSYKHFSLENIILSKYKRTCLLKFKKMRNKCRDKVLFILTQALKVNPLWKVNKFFNFNRAWGFQPFIKPKVKYNSFYFSTTMKADTLRYSRHF